jgi:DNA-directed RNA polymerase subunit RPC12/RpoP
MTLPFGDSSKKYVCFCCGVQFSEYDEFKSHIVENHEEGREYVRCPLDHCGAPVRDVKLHMRVKHPSFDMRSFKGQARAIVWSDFSAKGKKTRKPKFKQGKYESTKTGKILGYRSGLEEKLYKILDQHEEVLSFYSEPFQIDYIHKGQAHKYTPDIFVTFMDGHKELWEVKPTNQTDLEVNKNKWRAAEEACKIRGWSFKVFTEQGIDKLGQEVRRQAID